jgi:hypothetical protein
MTGTDFGLFILGLIAVAIVVAIMVWLLHWLYLRSSKERSFVRTGLGGTRVVLGGGALVLPIVHEVIPVNMNTLRLEVARGRDKALITKDRMRVVEGLGGGGGETNGTGLTDSVINSALRFRAQAPLIDRLLREIGVHGGDIGQIAQSLSATALPPVKRDE